MTISDILTAEEVRTAVNTSPMSALERRRHLQFIRHFLDVPFYANTSTFLTSFQEEDVQFPALPGRSVTHLSSLAGCGFP